MALTTKDARQLAARVAKQLAGRGRTAEAVGILCAAAVTGPSDAEGQSLLADALSIDPRSPLAKMAFERMEGMGGDHAALEEAIARFGEEELTRLDRELRPAFRKAQLGFNNDLKYKGLVYHVQTEDSGLDKPHVITHLFADGGRIIKSFKRTYANDVGKDDVTNIVRELMKGQHMEMVLSLREGRFDAIIEGRERGGMEVLETAPSLELARVGTRKIGTPEVARGGGAQFKVSGGPAVSIPASVPKVAAAVAPALAPAIVAPAAPMAPMAYAAPAAVAPPVGKVHFHLHVLRSLTGGPERYEPAGEVVVVGSQGAVTLDGEHFCHPREAELRWVDGRLWLHDLDGGNGVFLRIRSPVEMQIGDELIIGDQLLRIEAAPVADHTPGPGPTYCYSSPVWACPFRVVQILEGGMEGAAVLARRTSLYIGSGYNDMIIPRDPLIQEHHCLLDEQAGTIVLYDLSSKTGVFVRVQGEQELRHGDELLFGRTRLLVDLSPSFGPA
jgi:hypothetical protein